MLGDCPPSRRRAGAILGAVIAAAASLLFASPAGAHTDIDYTLPADQEQVAEPVSEITVAFNDPVTLVGAGFEVFTPQEVVVQPTVSSDDNMVFVLQLDAPLAGGPAGVRYQVAAADGHVLEGSFSFTVPAPPATTAPPPAPPTTAPATPASTTALTPVTSTVAPTAPAETAVVAPSPTTAAAGSIVPVDDTADDAGDDDGGSSTGLFIGVAVAVAAATAAFVVMRARASRAT